MTASKTKGVLTYYYRIDPSVSSEINGFWYIDLNGQGFEEHEVTDITQYDVEDTSKLVISGPTTTFSIVGSFT